MDERIEKLSLEVGAWFPDGYPSAEGDNEYWENLVIFEKAQLEKFVEVIVNECLACFDNEDAGDPDFVKHLIKRKMGISDEQRAGR